MASIKDNLNTLGQLFSGLAEDNMRSNDKMMDMAGSFIKSATIDNPLAKLLSEAIANKSIQPAMNDLRNSAIGTEQRLQQAGMRNVDPTKPQTLEELKSEEGKKALKKFFSQSAQEILQQPGGDKIIADSIGIQQTNQYNSLSSQQNLLQFLASGGSIPGNNIVENNNKQINSLVTSSQNNLESNNNQEANNIDKNINSKQKKPNFFQRFAKGFVEGGLAATAPELLQFRQQEEQAKAELQKDLINSQSKILQDQIESIEKRSTELIDTIYKPQSPELNTKLSQIESALNAVDQIVTKLNIVVDENSGEINLGNKDLLNNKNFLNKNRQELIRLRDVYINKALRRDTGAAIGVEEEKQFKKTYGFDIGVKSYLQNPEVIAKSILEAQDQLSRDRRRLSPTDDLKVKFDAMVKDGHSPRDVAKYLIEIGQF